MKEKLSTILQFKNGKKRPKEEGTIPVYGGNGILGYTNESNYENCIAIGRVGAYCGSVYYEKGPCWISDNAIAALIKDGADITYAYYLLKSQRLNERRIGTSQPLLTQEILNKIEVDILPYEEQVKVGRFLNRFDEAITLNEDINKNLLQQALTLFEEVYFKRNNIADKLPLYDYADYINGAAFKSQDLGDTGLPVIKIAELKAGITDSTRFFSGSKDDKYLVFNKDILFSWSGNPETSIDIFVWAEGDGILNQHTFNVKSKFKCPWFTFLMLKYYKPEFTHIASNKQTTGLGHVTAADLKRLTFPFDLSEMQSFESTITPTMDLFYGNLLKNKRLAQLRDALLPKLMTGELDISNLSI